MGWIDAEKILRHNMKEDIKNDNGESDENMDSERREEMWLNAQKLAKKRALEKKTMDNAKQKFDNQEIQTNDVFPE